MRAIASVALVTVVVLGGCIGGLGAVDSTGASKADYPPGVTADGITDPTALLMAHEDVLAKTGYELSFELDYQANDTSVSQSKEVRVTEDGSFLLTEQSTYGDQTLTRSLYSDGTTAYERNEFAGQESYSGYDAEIAYGELTGSDVLQSFLTTVDYTASEATRNGEAFTLLKADRVSADPFGLGEGTTVTSTAAVGPDGLVKTLDATVTKGEQTVTIAFSVASADPTVTEPAWVSENRDEMTIADLDYTIEGDALKVKHVGGDVLPEGTEITLVVQERAADGDVTVTYATLDADLAPGQTATVHNVGSETEATAYVGSHEEPEGASVIDGIVEVTVRDGMSLVDLSYLSSDE
ncbi:hypothetical protein [Haloarchaeobius sp. DT45]|uniref:hypothetical protein n=1 Tax=Haloarchaeobius sp. DT45 TaxID=3446116 RepID=UPI003F6A903D